MFETNVIGIVERVGYEIRTWIKAEEGEFDDTVEQRIIDKFKEVGVKLESDDQISWEWY